MLGIKHLLVGPTEDEIINNLAGNPDKLLIFASKESSIRCAESALNAGASKTAKLQALISASKEGNLEIVQLLIEHCVNIHEKKDEALRKAAYHGHLNVIELLVTNGADIHANNEEALSFAVWHTKNANLDIVKYLLQNGAKIEISKNSHQTKWQNIKNLSIKEYLDNL